MELIASEWGKAKTFPLPFITYGATDFKTGVTLATGDVKISKDGGAFANIATLPTVLGAWMVITLSATEMRAKSIAVQIIDQDSTKIFEDTGAILATTVQAWYQKLFSLIESQRGSHTGNQEMIFWDPIGGNDANSGLIFSEPKLTYNFNGANGVHDLLAANQHQIIIGVPSASGAPTTINEYMEIDTAYTFFRGPGRDFLFEATHNEACCVHAAAEGVELSGFRTKTKTGGSQNGICASGDFTKMRKVWVDYSRGSGIEINNASSCELDDFLVQDAAQAGSGHAVHLVGDTLATERNIIKSGRIFSNGNGGGGADGIRVDGVYCQHNFVTGGDDGLYIHNNTGYGIQEVNGADDTIIVGPTIYIGHNTLGDEPQLIGSKSTAENWQPWAKDSDTAKAGADGDTLKTISDQIDGLVLTGTRAITLQLYETGGTTPIADAAISIFNSDQTLFMGRVTTDSNGQATIGRDDGTYKLICRKATWTFTVPETLVVEADATEIIYGDAMLIPVPENPDACNVICDLKDFGLDPKAGIVFTANLVNRPQAIGNIIINDEAWSETTGVDGRAILTLPQGVEFIISSNAFGPDSRTIRIDTTGVSSIILASEL